MIARIDHFLGLRVFQPVAIRLCWLLRYSQYRLHREIWFAVGLYWLWERAHDGSSWWRIIFTGLLVALLGLRAALAPDSTVEGTWRWLRTLLWITIPIGVLAANWTGVAQHLALLVAEYAITIKTLPPKPGKQRALQTATEAS